MNSTVRLLLVQLFAAVALSACGSPSLPISAPLSDASAPTSAAADSRGAVLVVARVRIGGQR